MLASTAARAAYILPSLPYLSYVDEGHVLHHAAGTLRSGSWDPGWYAYPSLTLYLIAGVFRALAFLTRIAGGRDLLSRLPKDAAFYDFVTPPELILVGRVVVLISGVAIVALGMPIARKLAGEKAGLVAGVLLAFCPALVQRSPVVIVDTVAACLALGAILAALQIGSSADDVARPAAFRSAMLAGALSGLAAAAKYPVGSVILAVLGTIALLKVPAAERARLAATAVLAACVGAVVGMPALVLKPGAVLDALREQARLYADPGLMSWGAPLQLSALREAVQPHEMGLVLPFLAVASALLVLARRRDLRRVLIPWLGFAAVLLFSVLGFRFQPFRNLLALVPLLIVMVPVAIVSLVPEARARGWTMALTTTVLLASFVPGLVVINHVYGRRDSRATLVDRLKENVRPGDRVLVLRELALLPAELTRLGVPVDVVSWHEARAAAETRAFSHLVFGELDATGYTPAAGENVADLPGFAGWCRTLPETFRVGSARTPMPPFLWRSADELLIVVRAN